MTKYLVSPFIHKASVSVPNSSGNGACNPKTADESNPNIFRQTFNLGNHPETPQPRLVIPTTHLNINFQDEPMTDDARNSILSGRTG